MSSTVFGGTHFSSLLLSAAQLKESEAGTADAVSAIINVSAALQRVRHLNSLNACVDRRV